MNMPIYYQRLDVFSNSRNEFGNPLAVVYEEEKAFTQDHRQQIAKKIGFSETAFIYDLETGSLTLFNPVSEVSFSGHALVGCAWYIRQATRHFPDVVRTAGAQYDTFEKDGVIWIQASVDQLPDWNFVQMEYADDVEAVTLEHERVSGHTVVWAWMDFTKGLVRARTFAPDWGIVEDEANGSGAMLLASHLNKKLEIHHGKGSVIYVKPLDDDVVLLGGRVTERERETLII